MSTVRVNLLPREIEEQQRARRIAAGTGVAVAVYVVILGLLYGLKLGDVADAREERDEAQAEVAQLQAELAELQQFRELADELETKNALLADAMETEISWARVLNDLSLSFPQNASLLTLAATQQAEGETAVAGGEVSFGPAVASITFTGYSVERYAPGVEAVLLEFAKVSTFFNVYLSNAADAEIGTTEVTNFNGSTLLNEDAYTRRYDDGLPEGVL